MQQINKQVVRMTGTDHWTRGVSVVRIIIGLQVALCDLSWLSSRLFLLPYSPWRNRRTCSWGKEWYNSSRRF